MAHLLIVDDEPTICWGLERLARQMGHSAAVASTAEQALELAAERRPDLVFLDVRLPGADGLSTIPALRRRIGDAPIVLMTAFGDLRTAVEGVRQNVFEHLVKPFDLAKAQAVLERALVVRAVSTSPAATAQLDGQLDGEELLGASAVMQELFREVALVAPSDSGVLLWGETGVGKELLARAIHRHSRRRSQPFVAVNVAALSPTLVESELFGHVAGAFTGAAAARQGLLERASGGTLFLDEIAEIPLAIQAKLLRALDFGEVLPVGASRPIAVDLRIVSATHQDLFARASAGEFRHDLLSRLATFRLRVAPLRERSGDVRILAEHFLARAAARDGRPAPGFSASALEALESRPWHGNVRELRNAIEHAWVLARGGVLSVEHLPQPLPPSSSGEPSVDDDVAKAVRRWSNEQWKGGSPPEELWTRLQSIVEPALFDEALRRHGGQLATAARRLGLHRITLRKKAAQYGLRGS